MLEIRTISIKNFKTHSGAIYPKINLYYQQFGRQIGKAPIVLVNHSLTGDANLTGDGGWWTEIIGKGKIIDTDKYTILGFNIPGNGVKGQIFNKPEDLESHNHIIPHQTTPKAVLRGAKIIDSIWGLGDRVHSISHSGNTASTSHTVALDKLLMEKKLKNDEKVYFISFGSGLGMLGISLNLPKEIEAW